MKHLLRAGALALVLLPLAGCASCPNCNAGQWIDAQINAGRDWLTSPQTQQAVANLNAGTRALTCAVAVTAQLVGQIETGVGAGKSAIGTDGKVYVVSADICTALGGTVGPAAVIP